MKTDKINERINLGDSIEQVAKDFDLPVRDVLARRLRYCDAMRANGHKVIHVDGKMGRKTPLVKIPVKK